MAFMEVTKGATSQSIPIEIKDSSVTTGAGLTGLAYNTAGLTAYYWRAGGTATAITLATLAAVNSGYSSGGFKEVDAANMPGMYRLDVPDAAFASGANWVIIELKGATNMAQCRVFIELCGLDKQDTVRAGLTGLANATPGATGGLLIAGTNSGATTFSAGMTISNGSGNALTLTSSGGNGDALELNGNGSGAAIDANAGATGVGFDIAGGATSGDAFKLVATSGHGMLVTPGGNGKHGIAITVGTANNATGITITGSSGTGACHGILVTSGSNAANTGAALKLDGSVASAGFSINGGSTSGDGIVVTTTSGHGVTITAAGSSKHGITSTGGTSGNGMTLVAGSGGATLDSTTTAAIGTAVWATGTRVLTAGTNIALAKGTGVTGFNDILATDVWAAATRTLTAGTNIVLAKGTGVTGFNDIQASDVWNVAVPGAFAAGTSGYILGTNLNATVSSRGTDTGVWAAGTRTLTSGANIALAKGTGVTGFNDILATDVWAAATRTLTSGANIVLAKGTGVTGFNDLATSDIDARLVAIGLDHLVQVAVTGTDITDNSIIAKLVSKSATADWDTYNNTTDSHEALRDRGDAAWITATGFSTHTAADIWSVGTRTLTSGANIALAKGTGVTGFNDLATSDIDARLVAIGLDHLVQVAVTGTDITDNSIIAKLVSKSATADWDSFDNTTDSQEALRDNLATATALAAAKTVCDSTLAIVGTTGVAIAAATQQAIADTLLTRNVSNVEGTAAEHTLCTVILASLEMAISGTTMTIKRTDGTTTHYTKTVTKVTSDDPIRGVN